MKEIFTDFYNKVLNFFQNTKDDEESTKETACNRLKLVLMQDRVHMDPFIMQKMREEMIDLLNKYLEIDNEALDLNLAGEGDAIALMFNIPVIRAKSSEEIEEYEQALKEKLAKQMQEKSEEETSEETEDNKTEEDDETETDDTQKTEEQPEEQETEEPEETEVLEIVEQTEEKKETKKTSKKSEN